MSNTLLMLCIPFAGLLLCIAVMPLVKPEWWEKHQAHASYLMVTAFCHSVRAVLWSTKSRRDGTGVYDR